MFCHSISLIFLIFFVFLIFLTFPLIFLIILIFLIVLMLLISLIYFISLIYLIFLKEQRNESQLRTKRRGHLPQTKFVNHVCPRASVPPASCLWNKT